jgi:hypothetical protein
MNYWETRGRFSNWNLRCTTLPIAIPCLIILLPSSENHGGLNLLHPGLQYQRLRLLPSLIPINSISNNSSTNPPRHPPHTLIRIITYLDHLEGIHSTMGMDQSIWLDLILGGMDMVDINRISTEIKGDDHPFGTLEIGKGMTYAMMELWTGKRDDYLLPAQGIWLEIGVERMSGVGVRGTRG